MKKNEPAIAANDHQDSDHSLQEEPAKTQDQALEGL